LVCSPSQPYAESVAGSSQAYPRRIQSWTGQRRRRDKEWKESLSGAGRVAPAERGRRAIERARLDEAEVRILLDPAQQTRLRQSGLQAEGPGAFAEPEVVAQLQLTVEQPEQIRTIEEEAIFGWLRGPRPGKPPGGQDEPANERLLAMLTEEQVHRWIPMTGESAKFPIARFGSPEARTQP
jgi:hypothetical protein